MSNLKEIRSRINSISSTMKITSAMKMVSAAKLKKAQDHMMNIKPYSDGLSKMIQISSTTSKFFFSLYPPMLYVSPTFPFFTTRSNAQA